MKSNNVTNIPSAGGVPGPDSIVSEARERWTRCQEWEDTWRQRFINDLKFAEGDSDNGYQWPNDMRQAREVMQKPMLTMNVIRQHNLQIVNRIRQNKSEIKIIGTGNGATADAASAFQDVIRRIEYRSNAQDSAYKTALDYQVKGGVGWWRIITQYADDDSFDQDILVRRVYDPLSVYMDPDCREMDCSDARFAFVFDWVEKTEFADAYPEYEDMVPTDPIGIGVGDRRADDHHVWLCEYFRVVFKADTLISFVTNGERKKIRASELPQSIREEVLADAKTKKRPINRRVVEWKLIAGDKVIDSTTWAGKYIPLIRVLGEETIIDGQLDRKGHTRSMKDAQRMYNYNSSAQVEFVSAQGKTPWLAAAKAIEEYEPLWNNANLMSYSVLPWNHVDDDHPEVPVPPPQRMEPPNFAPAYQAGMDTAFNQMMMVSGQWQNQMGMAGNERTGRAIAERQEQSDTSVFHFEDNYAAALRCAGKQMIDLIPRVYDTKRVLQCMGQDGVTYDLEIDPGAQKAFQIQNARDADNARKVFNPMVGSYDVMPDVGPAYGTKRKETAQSLEVLLAQAPQLTTIVGDLLMGSLDFDKAQEAAQRLKRMIPKQALGEGPTEMEAQLQEQVGALTEQLAEALNKLGEKQLKLVGKDQLREIDAYKAETGRIDALGKLIPMDPAALQTMVQQLVMDVLQSKLGNTFTEDAADQPGALVAGGAPANGVVMQ